MADERIHTGGPEAPPAGESVHLPGPSYLPVLTAFGITLAVTGVVLSLILVVIGVLVAAIAIWRWIGETRTEMAELPLEHH
jgi:mannose/fructose/N-acetylgalactosamine-specific phosphotransferase system component IID